MNPSTPSSPPQRASLALAALVIAGLIAYPAGRHARIDRQDARATAERQLRKLHGQIQAAREAAGRASVLGKRLAETLRMPVEDRSDTWPEARTRLMTAPHLASTRLVGETVTEPATEAGLPRIRIRHLSMETGLLHAQALAQAFETLPRQGRDRFIPLGCEIRRLPSADASPPLQAMCAFDWLTIHPEETGTS